MTKNTMTAILSLIADIDTDEAANVRAAINEELARNAEKAARNRDMYDTAKEVVLAHLTDSPVTATELFTDCEDELPDGFTRGKMVYALRAYWTEDVVTEDDSKRRVKMYRRKA